MNKLVRQTNTEYISMEISKNKKTVAISYASIKDRLPGERVENIRKICEFSIEMVWDMIRDAVATADICPDKNPGLYRRKGEAAAGILYTNELYGRK